MSCSPNQADGPYTNPPKDTKEFLARAKQQALDMVHLCLHSFANPQIDPQTVLAQIKLIAATPDYLEECKNLIGYWLAKGASEEGETIPPAVRDMLIEQFGLSFQKSGESLQFAPPSVAARLITRLLKRSEKVDESVKVVNYLAGHPEIPWAANQDKLAKILENVLWTFDHRAWGLREEMQNLNFAYLEELALQPREKGQPRTVGTLACRVYGSAIADHYRWQPQERAQALAKVMNQLTDQQQAWALLKSVYPTRDSIHNAGEKEVTALLEHLTSPTARAVLFQRLREGSKNSYRTLSQITQMFSATSDTATRLGIIRYMKGWRSHYTAIEFLRNTYPTASLVEKREILGAMISFQGPRRELMPFMQKVMQSPEFKEDDGHQQAVMRWLKGFPMEELREKHGSQIIKNLDAMLDNENVRYKTVCQAIRLLYQIDTPAALKVIETQAKAHRISVNNLHWLRQDVAK